MFGSVSPNRSPNPNYKSDLSLRITITIHICESDGKSYGADTANYGRKAPTQWTSRSGATPEIAEELYQMP